MKRTNRDVSYTASELEFMNVVARATAANPFSEGRAQANEQIVSLAGMAFSGAPTIAMVSQAVHDFVIRLEAEGRGDLRHAREPERELLRTTLLFDRYHRVREVFDVHIRDQVVAGREPLEVTFARSCLSDLERCGFDADEAVRSFSAFFQLRRAYYFLSEALIGTSPCMQALRGQLWNNVFTHDFLQYERLLWNRMEDFATLLLGETGVGKGAAAAAIGRSGFIPFDRAQGTFEHSFTDICISVNLSQFAESLIESELFGHRRGAFTGAVDAHEGVLSRCLPNGAIFLDEIGDLAAPVQLKLLRVLQERVFTPVGSHDERRFAGRVIAATNRPLDELRRSGTVRDDFYYRLCSDRIEVPSLRRRLQEAPGELEELVGHVLGRLCGQAGRTLTERISDQLRRSPGADYAWPGNVRELEQAIRAILLKGDYEGDPLIVATRASGAAQRMDQMLEDGQLTAQELLSLYCGQLYEKSGNYGEVARRTGLDRRTVRKYVLATDASIS